MTTRDEYERDRQITDRGIMTDRCDACEELIDLDAMEDLMEHDGRYLCPRCAPRR